MRPEADRPAHGGVALRRDGQRLLSFRRTRAAPAPHYIDHKFKTPQNN
jgi:hypothetical protein